MDVLQGFGHLKDVVGCPFFFVSATLLRQKVLVELTSRNILQNEVNFVCVVEKAIHGQNVGVAEVAANLDLSFQLLFDSTFYQLTFV